MPISNPYAAVVIFALAGILLSLAQILAFQLLVRHKFSILAEFKEENPAIGLVVAGQLISVGLVVHSTLLHNGSLVGVLAFGLLGIVLNLLAYLGLDWATPGWDLSQHIDRQSLAGGWAAWGAFIMVGLVVAGALG